MTQHQAPANSQAVSIDGQNHNGRSDSSILRTTANWGYYLLPKTHPTSPGYGGLLTAIREIPTQRHFDPELIRLRLCDKETMAKWVTLRLQPPFREPRHVCPGRVVLFDRVNKAVHFFTFGGTLTVTTKPGQTVYALSSSAPILEIVDPETIVSEQLAFEVETLLAKYQAKWGLDDNGFAQRLGCVDPLKLYLASLQAILAKYRRSSALRDSFPSFYAMLRKEKVHLERSGQWSAMTPSLEELLAPPE